jgi:intron-binding protein aquarius
VLESIQELTQTDLPMPSWLQEVFLGYGDPADATNLPNCPEQVDFRDTFLNWNHLVESFPNSVRSFGDVFTIFSV